MHDPVVIVGAARTAMGGFQGEFKSVAASDLGAAAIRAAVERAAISSADIDDVLMGCVLSAGQGQAPARQAAIAAAIPNSVGATTINKMCGSGMKAIMLAHDQLAAGSSSIVLAGGMESMSNAPYLLDRARNGYRLGHGKLTDHMFLDGLEDAYDKGRLMGTFAEDCTQEYQFTRAMQDDFALASLERARRAIEEGAFEAEIAPVGDDGVDELPGKAKPEKARLSRRRNGDGGEFQFYLGWCSRSRSHAPFRSGKTRPFTAGDHYRSGLPCGCTRQISNGSHRRDDKAVRKNRLVGKGCRSVRNQRGFRGCGDGGHA